jgi:hypothetical protein
MKIEELENPKEYEEGLKLGKAYRGKHRRINYGINHLA